MDRGDRPHFRRLPQSQQRDQQRQQPVPSGEHPELSRRNARRTDPRLDQYNSRVTIVGALRTGDRIDAPDLAAVKRVLAAVRNVPRRRRPR